MDTTPADVHRDFTQPRKDTPSSHYLKELSPKLTTYLHTKQVSVDTGKLKISLHPVRSSWIISGYQQQKQQKVYKPMETEQFSIE